MSASIRVLLPRPVLSIPGDAQVRLDARLRAPLKFIWASREHLALPRMSLGGELMRFGLAEWSGARQLAHAGASDEMPAGEDGLLNWTVREVESGESSQMRPVVVCNSTAQARGLLQGLASEGQRGVLLVGSPHQWPGLNLVRRSASAGLLADLLPGVPVAQVAWLGMADDSQGLESQLALAAHEGGLAGESIEFYIRAAGRALSSQNVGEVWFVVYLDAMTTCRPDRTALEIDVITSVLGAFDAFDAARGVVLVSSAPAGAAVSRTSMGVLAKRLGACLASRQAPRS
jgi:hypothetical protein